MRRFFTMLFTMFFGLAFMLPGITAHYCKGKLIDSTVIMLQNEEGCCTNSCTTTSTSTHNNQKLKKGSCCTDLTYEFSIDEYHFENVFPDQLLPAMIYLLQLNPSLTYETIIWKKNPSPPNLIKVSRPFIQVFLI